MGRRNKNKRGRVNSSSTTFNASRRLHLSVTDRYSSKPIDLRKLRDSIKQKNYQRPYEPLQRPRRVRQGFAQRFNGIVDPGSFTEVYSPFVQVSQSVRETSRNRSVCDQRRIRREVIHALGLQGKGAGGGAHTWRSKIKCK